MAPGPYFLDVSMLQIHRTAGESLVIGDEIEVVVVKISKTQVQLALTGVDDRPLEFVLDSSLTNPDAPDSKVLHVRAPIIQ